MNYDPDLKEAMLKIQEIMDEYEIGGNIALASKSHSEFLYYYPKWCALQLEQGNTVRIKSELKDFNSKEEQRQNLEESTHFIAQMQDLSARSFAIFERLFEELKKHYEIEHKSFSKFTPHFEN